MRGLPSVIVGLIALMGRPAAATTLVPERPPPPVGKYLVTGATDGVGRWTAELLAKAGHHVLVHGYRESKVRETVDNLRLLGAASAKGYVANLAIMKDVHRLGAMIALDHDRIDGLLNNAGSKGNFAALEMGRRVATADGYEYSLAVNVLAPFLLTSRLLPLIATSGKGRILFQAAIDSPPGVEPPNVLEGLECDESVWDGQRPYQLNRLCGTLLALELQSRFGDPPTLAIGASMMDQMRTTPNRAAMASWGCQDEDRVMAVRNFEMLTAGRCAPSGECPNEDVCSDIGMCPTPSTMSFCSPSKVDLVVGSVQRSKLFDKLVEMTGARWPVVAEQRAAERAERSAAEATPARSAAEAPPSRRALRSRALQTNGSSASRELQSQAACLDHEGELSAAELRAVNSYVASKGWEKLKYTNADIDAFEAKLDAEALEKCPWLRICPGPPGLWMHWFEQWGETLDEWWGGLPMIDQAAIGNCLGALSLHLGSRFKAARRAWLSIRGKADGAAPPPAAAAQPGCELVTDGSRFEIPDFPDLPSNPDAFSVFSVPTLPLPRLLPNGFERKLLSAARRHGDRAETETTRSSEPQPSAASSTPALGVGIGIGLGLGIGVGVGLALCLSARALLSLRAGSRGRRATQCGRLALSRRTQGGAQSTEIAEVTSTHHLG